MPWLYAGRRGLVQEGSFALGFKGRAQEYCLGAHQLYGIRLSVVAGNGQLMPREKTKRKDNPWACIVGKSCLPFKCEK